MGSVKKQKKMNKSLHTEVGAKRGEIEITVLVFLSAAASLYMYKYMSNHVHNDSVGAAIRAVECSECGLDSTWTRCFQASILDSKTRFSQSAVVGTGREVQSSASTTCLSSGTSHPIFKTPFGAKANCWETCMFLSCSVRTFIWKGEQPEIVGENAFFTVWAITGWKCRLDACTNERTNERWCSSTSSTFACGNLRSSRRPSPPPPLQEPGTGEEHFRSRCAHNENMCPRLPSCTQYISTCRLYLLQTEHLHPGARLTASNSRVSLCYWPVSPTCRHTTGSDIEIVLQTFRKTSTI